MARGFFPESVLLESKAPLSLIPQCGKCQLYKSCRSPKMPPTGKGRRRILIVAEAPGKDEDRKGKQLCGKTGQHAEKILKHLDTDMRGDCWLTNSIICRPPDNATPTEKQIKYCQPNLINTIKELEPEIIIPMGASAVKSIMSWLWGNVSIKEIGRWVGWNIPSQKINAWVCPVWHPSYVVRERSKLTDNIWKHHLQTALSHTGRPWDKIPNYEGEIEKVKSSKQAARMIKEVNRRGGKIAFDYETTCLKPDSDFARIVSCSICWRGKKTFAFLWYGQAIDAMRDLLRGKSTYKIASNLKFEERWTIHEFGHGVRNWLWDTMLAAHWLDSRKLITGLKFQAFVLLGHEGYDDHIRPLLGINGDSKTNQIIKEVDLDHLLTYNGLDSLLEYKVAAIQMKIGNYDRYKKCRAD